MTAGLVLAFAFSPYIAIGQSTSDLQAQINNLLQRVRELQLQLTNLQSGVTDFWCFSFNNNLGISSFGVEVSSLATALAKEGLLSTPNNYVNIAFDETLASSVSAFQEKYRSEILTPAGLSEGSGYVGARTRVKLNSLYSCGGGQIGGQTGTGTTQTSSLMSISLQPSSGPVGTQINIVGNGFTTTGNKIRFGNTFYNNNSNYSLNSIDGRTLTFTVPSASYYGCPDGSSICYSPLTLITPGTYPISIMNTNGTSNTVTFTVTPSGSENMVPAISYISPPSGTRSTKVTIVGSGFTPLDNVQFSDYGTYVSNNYVNSETLTFTVPSALVNCNISGTSCNNPVYPTVVNGNYNIRVINSRGTSNPVTFTIVNTPN